VGNFYPKMGYKQGSMLAENRVCCNCVFK